MQNFGRNMNLTSLLGYLSQIVALSLSWRVATMTFHVLGERAPRAKNGPFRLFFAICSKNQRSRIRQKLPYDFRPGVNLQGKITPDPQLHMDPQIIPTPYRP